MTCALNYPVTFEAMAGQPIRASRFQNLPGIHRAKDGWGGFMVITGQQWHDFCALIDRPDWIEDDSLLLFDNRVARREELLGVIDDWMADHTLEEMLDLAASFRVPAAPLGNGLLTPTFAHPASEGLYEPAPDGTFLQPVPPYRFSSGAGRRRPRPAPRLGQRSSTSGGGRRAGRPTAPTAGGPRAPHPHADHSRGSASADLTAYWAGPIVGRHLAMMGADVIRIESPDKLDGLRFTTPKGFGEPDWWEWAPMVSTTNIGKRHLGLDLSTAAGRDVLLRLAAVSDVVIENFTPRIMENWGLEPDRLLAAQPGLVVMRMPGFGLSGPWRDRPAYAQIMEMISGMAWVTGLAEGPPLLPNGQCDPIGGHQALTALLLALEHRRQTGLGVVVECPLLLGALQVAAEQVVTYSGDGVLLGRLGNRDPSIAPQGVYRCADEPAGGEAWVAIQCLTTRPGSRCGRAAGSRRGRLRHPWTTSKRAGTHTTSSTRCSPRGAPASARRTWSTCSGTPTSRSRRS